MNNTNYTNSELRLDVISEIDPKKELGVLEKRLKEVNDNSDSRSTVLKMRVYEILLKIQKGAVDREYPMPSMFIVLGYDCANPLHKGYYTIADRSQNLFNPFGGIPIPIDITSELGEEAISQTKDLGGAVLIDTTGYITDSGIILQRINYMEVLEEKCLQEKILRRMNYMAVLEEKCLQEKEDLSTSFGFYDKVGVRELTAICASCLMDVTTFTLSKKTGLARVFREGEILYSQHPKEPVKP